MTQTEALSLDELLLDWVRCARISRTDKQSLLLDSVLDSTHAAVPSTARNALAVLESVSALPTDILHLRQQAEALTLSDDVLQARVCLSVGCTMELRLGDTAQVFAGPQAVDEIAAELCAQQQSLHAAVTRGSAHTSDRRYSSSGVTRLRCVSSPQSWLVDPSASLANPPASLSTRYQSTGLAECEPYETGPLRVGTLVTYYGDADRRRAVFSVHTLFGFAVDGQHVESIVRTLQTRDGSTAVEALTDVHFGYLLEKRMGSACI